MLEEAQENSEKLIKSLLKKKIISFPKRIVRKPKKKKKLKKVKPRKIKRVKIKKKKVIKIKLLKSKIKPKEIKEKYYFNLCKNILSNHYVQFDIKEIKSKSRRFDVVFKRSLICFILRKNELSLPKIAKIVNRTHASVINLLKFDRSERTSSRVENKVMGRFIKQWQEITSAIADNCHTKDFLEYKIQHHENLLKSLKKELKTTKK
jgi:hypothetical protein